MSILTSHPLAEALVGVPGAIAEVGAWAVDRQIKEADGYADAIGSGADVLWMDEKAAGKNEISPAEMRTAVTNGLAILAHRAGGVSFGGAHWCAAEHADCPGPGRVDLPPCDEGKSRGAVFTPRDLAEEVTLWALEATLYNPGPMQTADRDVWRVLPSADILTKRTGDISVGSGVFLLAACRYYAARLVEAWNVEAGLPADEAATPAMDLHARRLAMGCIYGVDVDPTSVELSRLSLALLAPTVPIDLTRTIVCGDALLGITSWAHILCMSPDHTRPQVFAPDELQTLMHAFELGRAGKDLPFLLADLAVGAALRSAGKGKRTQDLAVAEAHHHARRVFADPDAIPEARAKAQEWLDAGLPEGKPSRRPLHWPLVFPEVFGYGVTDVPVLIGSAVPGHAMDGGA